MMKKTAAPLIRAALALAVPVLGVGAAGAQPAPPMGMGMGPQSGPLPLDRCDKPLAAVDFMMSELQKCHDGVEKAAAANLGSAAAASTVTLVEVPAGTVPQEIASGARAKGMPEKLMRYYADEAFVTRDLKACAPLKYLFQTAEPDCVQQVQMLDLARGWNSPEKDFTAACTSLNYPELRLSPECCSQAYRLKGQPGACGRLVPRCVRDASTCRSFYYGADPRAVCKRSRPKEPGSNCATAAQCEEEFQVCVENVIYAKAASARNPKLCGGNRRCRLLMGQGQQVLREEASDLMINPAGKWFVTRGWERPTTRRVETLVPPAPNRAVQAQPRLPTTLPGFTCQAPLGTAANRRVIGDVVSAADACLKALDDSQGPADRAAFDRIDDMREQLVRAKLKAGRLLEGSRAAPKAAKGPGQAAPKRRRAR